MLPDLSHDCGMASNYRENWINEKITGERIKNTSDSTKFWRTNIALDKPWDLQLWINLRHFKKNEQIFMDDDIWSPNIKMSPGNW